MKGTKMHKKWDLSQVSFLVIEDNMHMRSILRSVLGGFGVRQVHEAADGMDGLEVVFDRSPDVILLDWEMTPLSGAEFVRALRAERDMLMATIPIIVVSAHSRKATILEAVKLGIHGFVAKPLSPAVLYDRVCDILQRQSLYGRSKGAFGVPKSASGKKIPVTDLSGPLSRDTADEVAPEDVSLALL